MLRTSLYELLMNIFKLQSRLHIVNETEGLQNGSQAITGV